MMASLHVLRWRVLVYPPFGTLVKELDRNTTPSPPQLGIYDNECIKVQVGSVSIKTYCCVPTSHCGPRSARAVSSIEFHSEALSLYAGQLEERTSDTGCEHTMARAIALVASLVG
jgi:hypothetical protein